MSTITGPIDLHRAVLLNDPDFFIFGLGIGSDILSLCHEPQSRDLGEYQRVLFGVRGSFASNDQRYEIGSIGH
jgi:hypothetical protein